MESTTGTKRITPPGRVSNSVCTARVSTTSRSISNSYAVPRTRSNTKIATESNSANVRLFPCKKAHRIMVSRSRQSLYSVLDGPMVLLSTSSGRSLIQAVEFSSRGCTIWGLCRETTDYSIREADCELHSRGPPSRDLGGTGSASANRLLSDERLRWFGREASGRSAVPIVERGVETDTDKQ